MRFSRPSTGTILAAAALFIALGGTAFAAGATVVNIADPTTPANVAHVTSSGQLRTTGAITNTVNTQLAAPSNYDHAARLGLLGAGCTQVAAPPPNKALIVTDIKIDVFSDPTPGAGQNVDVYPNATCTFPPVGDVNPPTVGVTTLPFDPGLGIPANSGVSVQINGSLDAETYMDGYSVPSSQVPTTGVTATGARALQRRQ